MRRPSVPPTVLALLALLAAVLLGAPAASAAPAPASTTVGSGSLLYSSDGHRCRVSLNARGGSEYYGLVLGHCMGATASTWYADAAWTVPVGTTEARSFPGDDYGIIRYTNTSLSYPGGTGFTGVSSPSVGRNICHQGSATGPRCGRVTAVGITIDYGGGPVDGLFVSNVCSDYFDRGTLGFSNTRILGIIVSGSGSCDFGGVTYYQPVLPVLAAYGLNLY
ncbi:S1 family peptidase [Streptomyces sp. CNQ085]|uniref:S1 family peptidase n=1 Tax=Streptomyces sp. CNQ085 TaxID=2886944 RepID=UPI001F50E6BC|nr:S1 family peptidase [Streptomyces sp. CNQ085]MCI0382992.1 S1 family peptidase [Streptomyces sp. CNQ085]